MDEKRVCFISGANRGIGFEFSRQLESRGWQVVAGYRSPERSRELLEEADHHETLHAFPVDVNNERQLRKLHNYINDAFGKLDLLINNAAINPGAEKPFDETSINDLRSAFDVNVLGPFLTTNYLQPLLAESDSARVVNIGSRAGSIALSKSTNLPYRLSKATLNMLTGAQAQEYKESGIVVISMTPGWVRTDMGGTDAHLSTEKSVSGMLKVIDGLTIEHTGRFFAYDGEEVPF
jgi:NAD(P)-dependent dehydrogenase (short-subunit alcohol dehydrogenase family)